MPEFPKTLDEAIASAQQSTLTALDAGCQRVSVDLAIPEIALQGQAIARSFADLFASYNSSLKISLPRHGGGSPCATRLGRNAFFHQRFGKFPHPR